MTEPVGWPPSVPGSVAVRFPETSPLARRKPSRRKGRTRPWGRRAASAPQ